MQVNPTGQVTLTAFAERQVSPDVRIEGQIETTVNTTENQAAPPVVLALTNSAGFQESSIVPGMLMSIFGQNLTLETESATSLPLPEALGGTSIQVGNGFGGMIFVSPDQANLHAPFESTPNTLGPVTVFRGDLAISNRVETEVQASRPGVFVDSVSGLRIVTDSNFRLITPQRPARPGDALIAFMSGLGVANTFVPTGAALPSSPAIVDGVTVVIDGIEVTPLFAGLTPGFVGLYQINFVVPEGLGSVGSPHLTIQVEVKGESSPSFRLPFVQPSPANPGP